MFCIFWCWYIYFLVNFTVFLAMITLISQMCFHHFRNKIEKKKTTKENTKTQSLNMKMPSLSRHVHINTTNK